MTKQAMKYDIYTKEEITERPPRKAVYLESYLASPGAPFVIVCPGGAYEFVSDSNEGKPFAEKLNEAGYNAFVLFYSVGPGNAQNPHPLNDVARAIKFIKDRADEFKVDKNRFALMGSSAGGHLCSIFSARYSEFMTETDGTVYDLRPSALLLVYPVISLENPTHKLTQTNFLGLRNSKKDRAAASVQYLVNEDYPPTFTWHNKDDTSVSCENSIMLKQALDKCNVRNELMLFEKGGHGVGLAEGKDAEGWIDHAISFLNEVIV